MRAAAVGGRVSSLITSLIGTVVLAILLSACSSEPDPTAVPTFSAPAPSSPSPAAGDTSGAVPDDCGRILAPGDLEALLGLPLGSVGVRTILGVAQPSVGRTERTSCDYTGGPQRRPLLRINVTAYADSAAAAAQWRVNSAAESGTRRDVPFGSASAALFERRGEAALLVAHSAVNLTVVLPDQPLPGGRNRGDVLVDIALRVVPSVSVTPASVTRAGTPPASAQPAVINSGTY
jgi:hypothetical protein